MKTLLQGFACVNVTHALRHCALGCASGLADEFGFDADDFAVLADQHDLGIFGDLRDAYDFAVAFGSLYVDHAFAAAVGEAVFVGGGALAVSIFGDGEDERTFLADVFDYVGCLGSVFRWSRRQHGVGLDRCGHADDVILFRQIHTAHSGGVAAHGADVSLFEADGLAVVRCEEDDLHAVGEAGGYQFVTLFDVDGDDASGADVREIFQVGLLDGAVARGEENVFAFFFEIADSENGAHGFAGLQREQAADMFALAGCAHIGDFVNLEPVDASGVGENEKERVRGGDEEMLDEIFVAGLHAHAPLASAALVAVSGDRGALEIAAVADGDGHLLVGDQVFELNFGGFVFDEGAAFVAVELFNFFELFDDDAAQLLFGTENRFVVGDVVASGFQLFVDFVDREPSQAMQLQFEDGIGLNSGERLFGIELGRAAGGVDVDLLAAEVGDQVFTRVGTVGAGANDGDHVVEVIERGEIAFENVLAVFRFVQQERGAASDDINAVIDEELDGLNEAELFWLSVDHGQEDHGKTFLHRGVLEQLVEHDLRLAAALEFDHDAHAVAITLIPDVA